MNFSDSKTWRNLRTAYDGELRASGKYRLYAEKAADDQLAHIERVFEETADNEQEHAELWLERLNGGALPATDENLRDAAAGEFSEWTDMYRRFAQEAREEGFHDLAREFERVAAVERHHNQRFCALNDGLTNGSAFGGTEEAVWICLNCGHIHYGRSAPRECPLCGKPQTWFTRLCECD